MQVSSIVFFLVFLSNKVNGLWILFSENSEVTYWMKCFSVVKKHASLEDHLIVIIACNKPDSEKAKERKYLKTWIAMIPIANPLRTRLHIMLVYKKPMLFSFSLYAILWLPSKCLILKAFGIIAEFFSPSWRLQLAILVRTPVQSTSRFSKPLSREVISGCASQHEVSS